MRQAGQCGRGWRLVALIDSLDGRACMRPSRKIAKSYHRDDDYARQLSTGEPISLNCVNIGAIVMKITIITVANSMRRLLY